jgi:phage antirepressor YoqD-like protein
MRTRRSRVATAFRTKLGKIAKSYLMEGAAINPAFQGNGSADPDEFVAGYEEASRYLAKTTHLLGKAQRLLAKARKENVEIKKENIEIRADLEDAVQAKEFALEEAGQHKKKIEELEPKADFAERIANTDGLDYVRDIWKSHKLKERYNINDRYIFKFLCEIGVLYRIDRRLNNGTKEIGYRPIQEWMDKGYMDQKIDTETLPSGRLSSTYVSLFTKRGSTWVGGYIDKKMKKRAEEKLHNPQSPGPLFTH